MDEKKDTKGHHGPIRVLKDNTPSVAGFGDVLLQVTLMVRKAEKLSIAAYLLTEHLDYGEPIKSRLRSCVLEFLKDINQFSVRPSSQTHRIAAASLREALTLLEIAALSKMISEGNHAIFKREIGWLSEMLERISGTVSEAKTISDELFSVPQIAPEPFPKASPKAPSIAATSFYKGHDGKSVLYERKMSYRHDKILDSAEHRPKNRKNGERRSVILGLIEKNKVASIKDIHNSFTDLSEKTIQRELTKMVREGVLERRGDKRWSRYALKTL